MHAPKKKLPLKPLPAKVEPQPPNLGSALTSNAIHDVLNKYGNVQVPPSPPQAPGGDVSPAKENPLTAQEYARVMAACAVRKEPKSVTEKPFKDVSPRYHLEKGPAGCHSVHHAHVHGPHGTVCCDHTTGDVSPGNPQQFTNFVQPLFAPPALNTVTPSKGAADASSARLPALPNSARKGSSTFTQLQEEMLQRQQVVLQRQTQKMAVTSQSYPQPPAEGSPIQSFQQVRASVPITQTSGAVVKVHPQVLQPASMLVQNNERQAYLSPRRPSVPHTLVPIQTTSTEGMFGNAALSPNSAAINGTGAGGGKSNPVSGHDVAAAIAAAAEELAVDEKRLELVGSMRDRPQEDSDEQLDGASGEAEKPSAGERTELAKLKVLLAQRCREAIQSFKFSANGSAAAFDVVIMQNEAIVWRSSTGGEDPSDSDGGERVSPRGQQLATFVDASQDNGKRDTLLTEAVESFDDESLTDVGEIRLRAKNAFQKTVNMFKHKLQEKQTTINKLKEEMRTSKPGGAKFTEMEDDLRIVREECRKQLGKIKTLVGLLDRAGQTIKYHEEQRQAEVVGNIARREGQAQWGTLRRLIPKLDVEPPRTDQNILQDVVAYLDDQAERIAESDDTIDELQRKIDADASTYDATQKAHKVLQRELDHVKFELETMKQRRQYESAEKAKEDIQNQLAKANDALNLRTQNAVQNAIRGGHGGDQGDATMERRRLLDQITSLENALKKSTEGSRGTLVPRGLEANVPLYLRYPSNQSLRILSLSKMAVENIVNGIWLSRCLPSVQQCKPIVDVQWLSTGASMVPDFNRGGTVAKGLARLFAAAVQAAFSEGADDAGLASYSSVSMEVTARQPSMMLDLAESALGASLTRTPELNPERPPACDFTDDRNWELWRIKRSEAKRLLHFDDHFARFLIECIDPNAARNVFISYSTGSGASTPPVSNQQLQKKLTLLMQAPIKSNLGQPSLGMPTDVAEVAYAVMDGCDRYSFDGDLNLFVRIARGEIPELAYFDLMIMLEKLRIAMLNGHLLYQAPHNWPTPTVATCFNILHRFFCRRSGADLAEMQRTMLLDLAETTMSYDDRALNKMAKTAASAEEKALQQEKKFNPHADAMRTPVDVPRLFSATESGNQGHFAEYLKASYIAEFVRHTDEVEAAIRMAADGPARAPSSIITGSALDDTTSETTTAKSKGSFRRRASSVTIKDGTGALPRSGSATAISAATPTPVAPNTASLHAVMTKLLALDPRKPIPEVEQFVYQVLLLYIQFKEDEAKARKLQQRLKGPKKGDAEDDEEAERPLSPPTPLEVEVLGMAKEEAWIKIGGKASMNFMIRTDVFATLSRKVFYRRFSHDEESL